MELNYSASVLEFIRNVQSEDPDFNRQECTDQFCALDSSSDRVNLFYNLMIRFKILPQHYCNKKNGLIGIVLARLGNECFNAGKYKEAWESYNKAAGMIPSGMSLIEIYRERAYTLTMMSLHLGYVLDLGRFHYWCCTIPSSGKAKVIEINDSVMRPLYFHEPVPSIIENLNHKFSKAAKGIEVVHDEWFGNHVIATGTIYAGQIVLTEKAFVSVITDDILQYCHECNRLCFDVFPCPSCSQAYFCSQECCFVAMKTYHSYECPILGTLYTIFGQDSIVMLALKLVLKLRISSDSLQIKTNSLISHIDNTKTETGMALALKCAIIFYLLKKHTDFFENCNLATEEEFKEILFLQMHICQYNSLNITELRPDEMGFYKTHVIGVGMYSTGSYFNHSCTPNVAVVNYDNTAVFTALELIRPGEQLFISYGPYYASKSKLQRQQFLNENYLFQCECNACFDPNWHEDLTRMCNDHSVGEFLPLKCLYWIAKANVPQAKYFLLQLIKLLSDSEYPPECETGTYLKHLLMEFLKILGNRFPFIEN